MVKNRISNNWYYLCSRSHLETKRNHDGRKSLKKGDWSGWYYFGSRYRYKVNDAGQMLAKFNMNSLLCWNIRGLTSLTNEGLLGCFWSLNKYVMETKVKCSNYKKLRYNIRSQCNLICNNSWYASRICVFRIQVELFRMFSVALKP